MEKTISYPKTVQNPNIQLEYNLNQNQNLNLAEKNALIQIENTKKLEDIKKSKQKEFKKKYNEKILSYYDEQKKKNEEEELNKKSDNFYRIQKMQNFNKTVYEKNKKKIINNNKNLIWIKPENIKNKTQNKNKINNNIINNEKKINKEYIVINHNNNDINNDIVNLQSADSNFIKKKTILIKSESNDDININENNININISVNENLKNKTNENNENIIDLRNNIQYLLDTKLTKKENININKEDKRDQINEKINELKQFRYDGTLPEKKIQSEKQSKKHIIKNKKFLSDFEKKRYIKALKNIFTERLGEHNIYIQNICSCGNLQKQLTALVERGHITIYALTNIECANNCIFYKNKKEYMKCIYDILNSIKKIKYENFHNKYK